MKKLILPAILLVAAASFSSCKRCGSCSLDNIEYCRGGAIANTIYDAAKADCQAAGGVWQ